MKRIFALLLAALLVLTLAACGGNGGGNTNGGSGNIEGSVEELLNKITDGATDPDMVLMTSEANDDNFEWYFFIPPVEGAEAWVSEPMMNAIAHFVGLIRVPEGTDPATVASDIEANMNPMKWVCVEPEKTAVVRRGDLVLVVMSTTDIANAVVNNFNGL